MITMMSAGNFLKYLSIFFEGGTDADFTADFQNSVNKILDWQPGKAKSSDIKTYTEEATHNLLTNAGNKASKLSFLDCYDTTIKATGYLYVFKKIRINNIGDLKINSPPNKFNDLKSF